MSAVDHDKARALIRSHFDLDISSEDERKMRVHLRECQDCSALYDRHLLIASLDPKAASAEKRLATGLGLKAKSATPWYSLQFAFGAALVAVVALLLVKKPDEFAARGSEQATQLAQIFVYSSTPGQAAQAVGSTIKSSDELAFAYVNSAGYSRLMIFGEDEHGHVYWYHPGWTNDADNPRAVSISAGPQLRELAESVRHDMDGKKLTIHAVFTNADLSVRDVEGMLEKKRAGGSGVPSSLASAIGDAKEVEITLTVE